MTDRWLIVFRRNQPPDRTLYVMRRGDRIALADNRELATEFSCDEVNHMAPVLQAKYAIFMNGDFRWEESK